MNRVIAVTAAFATAAVAGTMVATIVPAVAAPRPATAHPAVHSTTGQFKAAHADNAQAVPAAPAKAAAAPGANFPPTVIGSEFDGGKYVTVVHCQGVDSPPPITLAKPARPLIVDGTGPSATVLKMLQRPDPYKAIYTCTVTVNQKVPAKPEAAKKVHAHKPGCEIAAAGRTSCARNVWLNTGFGGMAPRVRNHHPAG